MFACRFDDPRYDFGNPATAVLDLMNDSTNSSNPVLDPHQRLPASTTVDAWAAFTLVPERTGKRSAYAGMRVQQLGFQAWGRTSELPHLCSQTYTGGLQQMAVISR